MELKELKDVKVIKGIEFHQHPEWSFLYVSKCGKFLVDYVNVNNRHVTSIRNSKGKVLGITVDNVRYNRSKYKLVLETFKVPIEKNVVFLDGDTSNYALDNLQTKPNDYLDTSDMVKNFDTFEVDGITFYKSKVLDGRVYASKCGKVITATYCKTGNVIKTRVLKVRKDKSYRVTYNGGDSVLLPSKVVWLAFNDSIEGVVVNKNRDFSDNSIDNLECILEGVTEHYNSKEATIVYDGIEYRTAPITGNRVGASKCGKLLWMPYICSKGKKVHCKPIKENTKSTVRLDRNSTTYVKSEIVASAYISDYDTTKHIGYIDGNHKNYSLDNLTIIDEEFSKGAIMKRIRSTDRARVVILFPDGEEIIVKTVKRASELTGVSMAEIENSLRTGTKVGLIEFVDVYLGGASRIRTWNRATRDTWLDVMLDDDFENILQED